MSFDRRPGYENRVYSVFPGSNIQGHAGWRGELAESQVYGSNSGGRNWVALSGGNRTGALPQFFGANGQPQVDAHGGLRFCEYSGLYSLSGAAIDAILGNES